MKFKEKEQHLGTRLFAALMMALMLLLAGTVAAAVGNPNSSFKLEGDHGSYSAVVEKRLVNAPAEASDHVYTFEITGTMECGLLSDGKIKIETQYVYIKGAGKATVKFGHPGDYKIREVGYGDILGYTLEETGTDNKETVPAYEADFEIKDGYAQMTIAKSNEGDTEEYQLAVTGPDGYSNEITLDADTPSVVLEKLMPGKYSVEQITGVSDSDGDRETLPIKVAVNDGKAENMSGITKEYTVSGTAELVITKNPAADGTPDPDGVVYTFNIEGPDCDQFVTTTAGGKLTLTNLGPGTYHVTQLKKLEGYTSSGTVDEKIKSDSDNDTIVITNTFDQSDPEHGSLKVVKTWPNGGSASITVQLQRAVKTAEGDPVFENYMEPVSLPRGDQWEYTWEKLEIADGEGNPYLYKVTETGVSSSEYNISAENNGGVQLSPSSTPSITLTNTKIDREDPQPQYGSMSFRKEWKPAGVEIPSGASISIDVLDENGQTVRSLTLSSANGWRATADNLLMKEANGTTHSYSYRITENNVSKEDFRTDVSESGSSVTITNTRIDKETPTGSLTVTKAWEGGAPEDLSGIQVQLLQNGEAYGSVLTLSAPGWSAAWDSLPVKDSSGNAYRYSVQEINAPEGYTSSVSGTVSFSEDSTSGSITVTNRKNPPPAEEPGTLSVAKTWLRGSLPGSIQVQLLQNGQPYGGVLTLTGPDWSGSWGELPVKDEDGNAYIYTVQELNPPAGTQVTYSQAVSFTDSLSQSATITNELPDEVTVEEDGVPKTYARVWDPEEEEWFYVPEDEIPLANMEDEIPATGDSAALLSCACLAAAAAAGLTVLYASRRKREEL